MTVRRLLWAASRVVVALALVGVVAVFVIMAVPGAIGAEHSYVVLTDSMAPAISPGDAVVVGDVDPAAVQAGDVITFRREADQPPVTHRVESVTREGGGIRFRTAGDNNEDIDPWTVAPADLVGKVWFTVPFIGHVIQFGNTPAGAAVLVGVPIVLLVLSELWARSGETAVTSSAGSHSVAEEDPVLPRFESAADARTDGGAESPSSDAGVRISSTDLRLGAVGFGTFAIYAVYIALGAPSGLTVGVAVGATVAALFHIAGLVRVVLARRADATEDGGGPARRTREVRAGD